MANKKISKYLKERYIPNDYARTWLGYSCPPVRVRVGWTADGCCKWAFFYRGKKRVWDCNYEFFKYHFTKETK